MKQKLILVTLIACSIMGYAFRNDGLIETMYPQLIGQYAFFKSVDNKKVTFAKDIKQMCSVTINRKDQLITEQKGKKSTKEKYGFISTKMPILEDPNHIMYGRDNFYQAMFYRGDTIVIENFPFEYTENYFVKLIGGDK